MNKIYRNITAIPIQTIQNNNLIYKAQNTRNHLHFFDK